MELRNRGALVTGASRGLGAALAHELAVRGAKVALVARHEDELAGVVASIRRDGGQAHAVVGELGAKDDAYRIAGAVTALVGEVDLVVHNASTPGPVPLRLLSDTACEDFERVLTVNLLGPFRLTKALVGAMVLRGQGRVVHLSSDAAVAAYPAWGPYGASKAGLDHLARIWAAELDGTGVTFLGIDPGEMDTQMHADAIPDAERSTLAQPADVARVVAAMVSDDSLANGARLEAASWRRTR